jgi:hypothetical protein
MLNEAFRDNALGQRQTYEYFKRFRNRWISVDDKERSGRPSTGPRKKMWQQLDIEGIVRKEFVPPGQLVNGKFCCPVLRRLWSKHPVQTSREAAQQLLGPASWQRCGSRISRFAAVFGFYEHDSHPPPSLLTGPRPLWLFPIPVDEIEAQVATFWEH